MEDRLVSLELGVTNQDGAETTPATATVVLFEDGKAEMPEDPKPSTPSGAAMPGTFLTQETIDKIGRTLAPVAAPAVGVNDIARWATATYWPERPPPVYVDADAAASTPWGGIVAPRDFDPFAWMPERPWSGDWLFGMGVEPGRRVLNGGQWNRYCGADPAGRRDLGGPALRRCRRARDEARSDGVLHQRVPLDQPGRCPRPPRGADHHLLLRSSHRDVEDLGGDVEGVVCRRHPGVDGDLHQYLDQFLLRDAEVAGAGEVAA